MTTRTKIIAFGILALLIIGSIFYFGNRYIGSQDKQQVFAQYADTLAGKRNPQDSSYQATISSLMIDKQTLLAANAKQGSDIQRLQDIVQKKDGVIAAMVFDSKTGVNTSTSTTITVRDTVRLPGGTNYIYPTYRSDISLGKWVNGYVVANRDTTKVNLSIHNEYDLSINKGPRKGFLGLGKRDVIGEIKSKNPYDSVPVFRVYNPPMPKKPLVKVRPGGYVGYGVTSYDNRLVTGWQAGGGIVITF